MKVYVVITSYQHGLGDAVETDAEVFDTIDKARKWKKDTLEKLSFLKSYGCEFESERFRSSFLIHPKKRGTIEVALVWHYEDFAGKHNSIARYHTEEPLVVNWNYGICGGECYSRKLSLDDFVKALVRRGIIKVEG